jgi:undecaprenyl diphosphate synthase
MVKRTTSIAQGQVANEGGLSHVLVCGGTLQEWRQANLAEWKLQLDTFVDSVHESGARWLTVCPYAGPSGAEDEIAKTVLDACGGQRNGNRISFIAKDGLVVVVDLCADGRERFTNALNLIRGERATNRQDKEISEEVLRAAMLPPGFVDPDLILVFGSPTQIPPSLMWELSYSELVFLDVSWRKCNVEHVQMAINDFQRRDRRFGGVDS